MGGVPIWTYTSKSEQLNDKAFSTHAFKNAFVLREPLLEKDQIYQKDHKTIFL